MKVCKLDARDFDGGRFGTCLSFFDQKTKAAFIWLSDVTEEKVITGFDFSKQLRVKGHFVLQSYHAEEVPEAGTVGACCSN